MDADFDPFFSLPQDSTWNACIGTQGDELNYVDGYIEAAQELADAIISKKQFGKRDTLVLPILYNARHAVELTLKFILDFFVQQGVIAYGHRPDHDIKSHYNLLKHFDLGDETLRDALTQLEPLMESLAKIDDDGQSLRYHKQRDGDPSMGDRALANIEVIRASLNTLADIIRTLKFRALDYVEERGTKSFTARCSRRDIFEIVTILPPISAWNTSEFEEAKTAAQRRYGLSNKQFSNVIETINANTEMKAMLGAESTFLHLSDDAIVAIITEWRKLHPKREGDGQIISRFDDEFFEQMMKHAALKNEILDRLLEALSDDEIADLEALFYLDRNRAFTEYYQRDVERIMAKQAVDEDRRQQLSHLLSKTNLLRCVTGSAQKFGRHDLIKRLSDI